MNIWLVDESYISSRVVFTAQNRFAALQKQFNLPAVAIKWFSLTEMPDAQEDTINDQCDLVPLLSQLKINRTERGELLGFTIYLREDLSTDGVINQVELEAKRLWRYIRARCDENEMQRILKRRGASNS